MKRRNKGHRVEEKIIPFMRGDLMSILDVESAGQDGDEIVDG